MAKSAVGTSDEGVVTARGRQPLNRRLSWTIVIIDGRSNERRRTTSVISKSTVHKTLQREQKALKTRQPTKCDSMLDA